MIVKDSGEIIGLDANVLVDLCASIAFKEELRAQVNTGVLSLFTTRTAVGEAKNVLIRKRGYTPISAINALQKTLVEFNIGLVEHNQEGNKIAETWLSIIKQGMYIKHYSTFFVDCRIIANLYHQKKISLFISEDRDLEKAVKLLMIPLKVKIIGEASNINGQKISEFFREKSKERRRYPHK